MFVNLVSSLSTHEHHTGSRELHNTFPARHLFYISMLQRLSVQINSGKQKVRSYMHFKMCTWLHGFQYFKIYLVKVLCNYCCYNIITTVWVSVCQVKNHLNIMNECLTSESIFRATCGRCGFTCDLHNVDYRYRLSFKVSRNQDIFGVTVFGGCLNPFFGITAGGLQRYVLKHSQIYKHFCWFIADIKCDVPRFIDLEKTDGTHTVQQLLVKAVEDCFIGRCVIFGLKVWRISLFNLGRGA